MCDPFWFWVALFNIGMTGFALWQWDRAIKGWRGSLQGWGATLDEIRRLRQEAGEL